MEDTVIKHLPLVIAVVFRGFTRWLSECTDVIIRAMCVCMVSQWGARARWKRDQLSAILAQWCVRGSTIYVDINARDDMRKFEYHRACGRGWLLQ